MSPPPCPCRQTWASSAANSGVHSRFFSSSSTGSGHSHSFHVTKNSCRNLNSSGSSSQAPPPLLPPDCASSCPSFASRAVRPAAAAARAASTGDATGSRSATYAHKIAHVTPPTPRSTPYNPCALAQQRTAASARVYSARSGTLAINVAATAASFSASSTGRASSPRHPGPALWNTLCIGLRSIARSEPSTSAAWTAAETDSVVGTTANRRESDRLGVAAACDCPTCRSIRSCGTREPVPSAATGTVATEETPFRPRNPERVFEPGRSASLASIDGSKTGSGSETGITTQTSAFC